MPKCPLFTRLVSNLPARLREERGQAIVEFAIVLPVLLMIIFGILYFGRYESYSNQMTQLAEVGARDAAVGLVATASNGGTCSGTGSPNPSIACLIQNQATGELAQGSSDADQVSVQVDCNPSSSTDTSCNPGENVTVCLQARVRFPALGIPAGTVYQTATMLVESQPSTGALSNSSASSKSSGSSLPSC